MPGWTWQHIILVLVFWRQSWQISVSQTSMVYKVSYFQASQKCIKGMTRVNSNPDMRRQRPKDAAKVSETTRTWRLQKGRLCWDKVLQTSWNRKFKISNFQNIIKQNSLLFCYFISRKRMCLPNIQVPFGLTNTITKQ